jgi:hypothetical protein
LAPRRNERRVAQQRDPAFFHPNRFYRFPFENPFVDHSIAALYDDSHLIRREAMTCPTFRCPR